MLSRKTHDPLHLLKPVNSMELEGIENTDIKQDWANAQHLYVIIIIATKYR